MWPMIVGIVSALFFWLILFGTKLINFWWGMTAAAGLLAIWSVAFAGQARRNLFAFRKGYLIWGLLAACALYLIFRVGDMIARMLFDFASGEIDSIYGNRGQLASWKIGLLLFFWIGPAEEIFWRGMVQRVLMSKLEKITGLTVAAFLYAGVHLWAANFTLFMAALICGIFWGWIYLRFGSLWPGIISHAVWDVTTFIILPV